MLEYQQRVIDEKTELDNKAKALATFITTNRSYQDLSEKEQMLMRKQLSKMWDYSDILHKRINLF